ncbi:cell wall-binding repeat-containing protein [Candidatus Poriferisodalis sp.]|uniref:cell wall-binding repeat-containing protein n=1 Tax=Candidatus Poriferisodalis sp. TaxID=3101277 RepID=UPI003B5B4230
MPQLGPSARSAACALVCAAVLAAVLAAPATAGAQSAQVAQQRIEAATDYELAATLAGGTCDGPGGSHSVALASGENWPDALAGTALDRPLLLTKQAFLPAATREYLEPCASQPNAKVIVLGGAAAVSEDVTGSLRNLGYRVDRIAGTDRYDTARRAARAFAPASLGTVYLASGVNFADAVAVAPYVSANSPLILTPPGALGAEAERFLTDPGRTVSSVTILGGRAAVSAEVEAQVRSLGIATRRVAGASRYETASMLARLSFSRQGCHPVTDVAVASGTSPYAGLVAGAVRGQCQPLLLAPPAGPVPETLAAFGSDWLLAAGSSTQSSVTAIGPMSSVSDAALAAVATGRMPDESGATETVGTGTPGGTQAWEQVAASVVLVQCLDSAGEPTQTGSGFAVDDGRQIVTNHHVVHTDGGRPCAGIEAQAGGTFEQAPARSVPATLVRAAEARDLALLALDPSADALPPVAIATAPLRAGEHITALGYPSIGGATMTLTTGRYSGITLLDGVTWIKTDTQIAPGNSGGPAFNEQRQLVGVASALVLAQTGNGAQVVGSLGLLAPSTDVAALLAGDIGVEPSNEPGGESGGEPDDEPAGDEGEWTHGTATNTGNHYVILVTGPQNHNIARPFDNVVPVLLVFCDDAVQIDFWNPLLDQYRGPFIAGQVGLSKPEENGRVPIGYRIGGEDVPFIFELWLPSEDNRAIISGDEGHSFVSALRNGTGQLAFGFTNFDGGNQVIIFPRIDGFAAAHDRLQQRCARR